MTQNPEAAPPPQVGSDGRVPGWQNTRKTLNVRFLAATAVAGVVLLLAAEAWQNRNVARMAGAFLEQAETAQKQGDWEQAARFLRRYVRICPDHEAAEGWARLARTFDRAGEAPWAKWKAVEPYYRALGAIQEGAPPDQQHRLRARLTQLLLELSPVYQGCSVRAEREARLLLKPPPDKQAEAWRQVRADDPSQPATPPEGTSWWMDRPKIWTDALAARLWVLAVGRQAKDGSIAGGDSSDSSYQEHFERALELNPGDIELCAIVARLYRDRPSLFGADKPGLSDEERLQVVAERAKRADAIVDAMVAANPQNANAMLVRYQYRADYGLPGAAEDLAEALRNGPEDVAVLLAAARHAAAEATRLRRDRADAQEVETRYQEAAAFCRRAIEAAPSREDGYLLLGEVCRAEGDGDLAIETWRRGLDQCGAENLMLHWRLMEALVAAGQLEEAKHHLDAVDRQSARLSPLVDQGSRLVLRGLNDLLRGQWLVAQGRFGEAIPLLRRVAVGRRDSELAGVLVRQAWRLLSGAYGELSQWDLAAQAHEEAAKLEPEDGPPEARARSLLAAADAWVLAGSPQRAAALYEQALGLADTAEARLGLAVARYRCLIALPPEQRNWEPFDKALKEARTRSDSLSEPWRVALAEAEAVVVKAGEGGQQEQEQALHDAADLLRLAETKHPASEPLLEALVLAYQGLALPADADRAMESLQQLCGPSARALILRSNLHLIRRQYSEAREVLRSGLERLPPESHRDLRFALAQVSLAAGEPKAACQLLLDLCESSPGDVRFVWTLAEIALESNDLGNAARWEDKLRDLEGPDGSSWRYLQARRLLAAAGGPDDPVLAEVAQLESSVQSQRPTWPAGYVLEGLRCERIGRRQRAIAAYEKAIQCGEQRISVYERLITLLYEQRDFRQARHYLSRLKDHVPASPSLSAMEVHSAAMLGDNARALEAAREAVRTRPADPMARIWLGQMLLRDGLTQEAEAALTEAVRLAPGDYRSFEAMFTFFLDTGQREQAKEELERFARTAGLSEAERILALAQGYQRLGEEELAQRYYRQAAEQPTDNVTAQKRLAALLFESDPRGAEEALRRVLRLAPQDGEARRALARLLAARGGAEEWQEALRLIEPEGAGEEISGLDRRLQAQLLFRRGGKENLAKAKRLLEQLIRDPDLAADEDRLLLAALYEQEGLAHYAAKQFAAVAERPEPEPAHVMSYVDFLLRHGRHREAERALGKLDAILPDWLARLQKQAPARAQTVAGGIRLGAARLRAGWLAAVERASEIQPLIDALADELSKQAGDDAEKRADVYLKVGDVYSAVEQHAQAERWYALLADVDSNRYAPLVAAKARQGQIGEAIQICVRAAASDRSARPAIVMATMLASSSATAEDYAAAEPLLSRALAEHSHDTELLRIVAYVRFLQKRADDAVGLYESVLARNPRDLLVLNNLATLLVEQPSRRKEALSHVDQAIAIAGPKAGFLDVKGTILALDGKASEAVALLEEASSLGRDPRYDFHLALAYQRAGEPDKARAALGKAQEGNLRSKDLTELDKSLLAELEEQLAP